MDHRYIVRQFELERMLTDADRDRRSFGGRYAERLLAVAFSTEPENLESNFPEFPASHQLLYAVNAFAYQLGGGGFGEFREETGAPMCLLMAIAPSLAKIGANELAAELPDPSADGGKAIIRFMDGLQRSVSPETLRELDRLTREYMRLHQLEYFVICDGIPERESEWTKSRLEQFTWDARNFGRDGQRHLFEPSVKETVSDMGKKKLGRLVRSCRALVERARKSEIETEFDDGNHCIRIRDNQPDSQLSDVALKYFESYQVDMRWGIFSWSGM